MFSSLTFKHLSTPSPGHDSHGRILSSFWCPSQYLIRNTCLPRHQIQWLLVSCRGDVQIWAICEKRGNPQGVVYLPIGMWISHTKIHNFLWSVPLSSQRHSCVCVVHRSPYRPGELWDPQASVELNDCGREWIWCHFSSKEGKNACPRRKKKRHIKTTMAKYPRSQCSHTEPFTSPSDSYCFQFALQCLSSSTLRWPFPFFCKTHST